MESCVCSAIFLIFGVHSNMNFEMFMNWDWLAQLLAVYGHAFQLPERPKQGPSKTLKPVSSRAKTPPGPLTKHFEQHASLTTPTSQNIATPDPMLQENRRHASHILSTQAQTYVSSNLSNPPALQRVGTTIEKRTRPCIWS